MRRRFPIRAARRAGLVTAVVITASAIVGAQPGRGRATTPPPVAPPAPVAAPFSQVPAGTPELLLDQGKRLFDAFQYDQAVPIFDRLVASLTPGGQPQRPELLVPAYELRARARFALGDSSGAEQDFSALLALNPSFKLAAGISPRVAAVLESVRKLTIGQVQLSLTPAGDVQIDGRTIALRPEAQPFDLPAGDHQITATRAGYRPLSQPLTIAAGTVATLALAMERVSATLAITTIPAEVDVVLDGTPRGATVKGPGDASAPLLINDLQPGTHRLTLRRTCHKDLERTITIDRPEDVQVEPLRLTPSVASVKVQPSDPTATVLMDGVRRGTGATDLASVCEGPHFIEVRSPKGRFVDRREWKTGDAVTLAADLRTAFPIVATSGVPAAALDRLRTNIERAFAPTRHVLVYFPSDQDLSSAVRGEDIPAGWLSPDPADASGATRVSREVRRDLAKKLATRLDVPGLAGVTATSDPNIISVTLLAAGSGDPDVVTINLADPTSRTRATDLFGATMPALTRASLDASVIDVAGTPGAIVIRTGPNATKAGLTAGDVIVAAGGSPVTSVADLRERVAAVGGKASDLSLDVKTTAGTTKKVAGSVALTTETLPMRNTQLPYNRILVDLQDLSKTPAASAVDTAAIRLNLAVVHMRLGNWEEALAALGTVTLPEGAGVSAGTVAYFSGLCHEALAHPADAQAAFTKAAASAEARLSQEGPLVAPLAQRKLQAGR